jgi:hypothetical protein
MMAEWHGVLVPPQARSVLETKLRKLAPAIRFASRFLLPSPRDYLQRNNEKWSGQPESHRRPLIGIQRSCY